MTHFPPLRIPARVLLPRAVYYDVERLSFLFVRIIMAREREGRGRGSKGNLLNRLVIDSLLIQGGRVSQEDWRILRQVPRS